MKSRNHKKIIVTSALIAGVAVGGTAIAGSQMANATSNENQTGTSETHEKPELTEEMKAKMEEKLSGMTEEEKQEWLENHKPKGGRPENGERPGKPANMTDEEWEQKVSELKAKLDAMTEEEKQEWLENHKPKGGRPENGERPATMESGEQPADMQLESQSEE